MLLGCTVCTMQPAHTGVESLLYMPDGFLSVTDKQFASF